MKKMYRFPRVNWELHEDTGFMWVTARHPVDGHEFGLQFEIGGFEKEEEDGVTKAVSEALHEYVAEHPEDPYGDLAKMLRR